MANVTGDSNNATVAAVKGENTSGVLGAEGVAGTSNAGTGVHGKSVTSFGVLGESTSGRGVVALSDTDYGLRAASRTSAGIRGSSVEGRGVEGWATKSEGVVGISTEGTGVWGQTEGKGVGVLGTSTGGVGVAGKGDAGNGGSFESQQGEGVRGTSNNPNHGGVVGVNTGNGIAVFGTSDNHVGVWGTSVNHEGVHAESHSAVTAAVAAYQQNPASNGAALYAKHAGNRLAGFFEGNIFVTGDITLANADCAEDFTVGEADVAAEPGTVMVLDEESRVRTSSEAYDKRVAGVISGAGDYRPGLVLDKQAGRANRRPIALMGKVFCKVDAQFGAIEVGDLLTTSATPGHAMRAGEPRRAFGAVIGKALRPLAAGQGLIPILIALQ